MPMVNLVKIPAELIDPSGRLACVTGRVLMVGGGDAAK
ncbi:hypothetical protein OCA8868_03078 [Octadecabacter ascidiaceicola]|uniref:Uncharacterized protein n=1 Tax=Octadecabacter ascidiaceicola TaxID=1655543 RepID=A0A238KPX9_9RHOB|nr:hypothetical protein OCA8868_03078 [Octadecabacter ascidiaceicola]